VKIRYCIPTLNQIQWVVDEHLPSIDYSLIQGLHLHISDYEEQLYNGGSLGNFTDIQKVNDIMSKTNVQFIVTSSGDNLGVAPSWNKFIKDAIKDGFDAVIVANDDIRLYEGSLEKFINALKSYEFVSFAGQNAFSFFGLRLSVVDKVGYFDEAFWPAYYEDNDYNMRLKLAGVEMHIVLEPSYFHAQSATLGKFNSERKLMHHHNFRKNTEYYIKKWGGLPHNETYTEPFDGQENYGDVAY
jgi:GT2 family glycosyltransferase